MKIIDIHGIEYALTENFLEERGEPIWNDFRGVFRSQLNETIKKQRLGITQYYYSDFIGGFQPIPFSMWEVKVTIFGRLKIGCRTFDRKNTKIILDWAKGAQ